MGITVACACRNNGIMLFSQIKLDSYPSCNDFLDPSINCFPGQTGNIMNYIGRPLQIRSEERFWEYDVYEVLVNGFPAQIFAANLKLISHV